MIKATLLILVIALALPCFADFYIDATMTDVAGCGTDADSACQSVGFLLNGSGSVVDEDSITITAAAGNYTTPANSNVALGNTPTTIESSSSDDIVSFVGETGIGNFIFSSNSTLTLNGISLSESDTGIVFTGSDLELDTVSIFNSSTAVSFTGTNTFTVDSSTFTDNHIDISATNSPATEVSITSSVFSGATNHAIMASFADVMESFSLSENTFQNGAGVTFTFAANNTVYATVDSCTFTNITNTAVEIENGEWTFSDSHFENVPTAFSVSGANTTFSADDLDITEFTTAFDVDGGSAFIKNCALSTSSNAAYGFVSTDLVQLKVTGGSFSGMQYPISVAVTENVLIQMNSDDGATTTTTFNNTGLVSFAVADNSNATVSHCTFMNPIGNNGALKLSGGMWGINDFEVTGFNSNTDGGAFSLDGVSFALDDCTFNNNTASNGNGGAVYLSAGSLALDDCTFTGNAASEGAGVYVSNVDAFSCDDSTFTENVASGVGGGISLASTTNTTGLLAHFEDSVFTSNTANNGAAISCCTNAGCNITLAYTEDEEDADEDVSLSDNVNNATDGTDVTCNVAYDISFSDAAEDPSVAIVSPDSPLSTTEIVIISIVVIVIIIAIILALLGAAFAYYKKRSSYTSIDDGFE